MRILYLCNCTVSVVTKALCQKRSVYGGWLDKAIDYMQEDNDIIYMSPSTQYTDKRISNSFRYIGFDNEHNNQTFFTNILTNFNPDIVHIWGSEFLHSYNMAIALKKVNMLNRAILSIQGIISEISKVYDYGLPKKVVNRWTIGDIFRKTNIKKDKLMFFKRGEFEIKTLKLIPNVIGRTEWDKAIVKKINSNINYYFCNESLRECFYDDITDRVNKENKIFICQSNYPIKGFHLALEILNKVKKEFPDIKIVTTGTTFTPTNLLDKLKQSSYQKYVRSLIIKYNMKDNIIYKGTLNAESIKEELMQSKLLFSPSVIENSPNSIGEAMILGIPVVTSNVGGVCSIISEKEGYLYNLDDIEKAKDYIVNILKNTLNEKIKLAKERAFNQYSIDSVKQNLNSIYGEIHGK